MFNTVVFILHIKILYKYLITASVCLVPFCFFQIWICLTGAVEIFSLWHSITVFTCGMPLKETSLFSWSWSARRTTSALCPGPKREATWLLAPVTAKFRSVCWWDPTFFLIHKDPWKTGFVFNVCSLFFLLSCGMLTTRSVYAAWPAIQPELVASAGMTMFFPGTVFSLDTKDKLKFPVFVWTRM